MGAEPNSVSGFYDLLSSDYDVMTGFEKRFVKERPFFRVLVERYKIGTALDAGCGSGFHAVLLSELGVRVTAVDVSEKMTLLTREHAKERGVKIKTLVGTFEELNRLMTKRFDAVFVMGNSLPHLATNENLGLSLRNFAGLLEPGGIFFSQMLNYDRILSNHDPVINVKEAGVKTFVRSYDYDNEGILFNILTRTNDGETAVEKLQTVRLRPILRSDFVTLLEDCGFSEIKAFGGISMEDFSPADSKDLVILARKAAQ